MNKNQTSKLSLPGTEHIFDRKIRVLVVDDSALMRKVLCKILNSDTAIVVVGTAPDPYVAREKIKLLHPDVLTLDIEMPKMNGVNFLRNLMRLHPMPVVMVSSYSVAGADITMKCLALGAIDFVAKPVGDQNSTMEHYAKEIIRKVKTAAVAKIQIHCEQTPVIAAAEEKFSTTVVLSPAIVNRKITRQERVIAIGASTGGTEALKEILLRLPANSPPIFITQHIPAQFCASLARRLDSLARIDVHVAEDGMKALPGHAYVAPGNHHLLLKNTGSGYICDLNDGKPVNRFKPSVDVMFRSVAQTAGDNSLGVILTGMGQDGARGIFEMHETGAYTIAQDENTSVVWGMPGAAVMCGAIDEIIPLHEIPAVLRKWPQPEN